MVHRESVDSRIYTKPLRSGARNGTRIGFLSTQGRKSGNPHTVMVRFLILDDGLYAASDRWEKDWCQNILVEPEVTVRLGELQYSARARPVDSDRDLRKRVLEGLGYGELLTERFDDRAVFQFSILAPTDAPEMHYEEVREAYDLIAPRFDEKPLVNPIYQAMRATSLWLLYDSFTEGDRVFELGCGSGEEATRLARRGVKVLATDISPEMVRITREKAERRGVSDLVEAKTMAIRDVSELTDDYPPGFFDGGYASYCLSYEPHLENLPPVLAELIKPSGHFVSSVRNKACLFELLLYGLTLRLPKMNRRWSQPNPAYVSDKTLVVRSYTYKEYVSVFENHFEPNLLLGVPILLPPHDIYPEEKDLTPILRLFHGLDKALRMTTPFNRLGDQILVRMRRA